MVTNQLDLHNFLYPTIIDKIKHNINCKQFTSLIDLDTLATPSSTEWKLKLKYVRNTLKVTIHSNKQIWKYENPFVITDEDITEAATQFTLIKEDDIDSWRWYFSCWKREKDESFNWINFCLFCVIYKIFQ